MRTALLILLLCGACCDAAMFDWGGSRPSQIFGVGLHIDAQQLTATNGQKFAELTDLSNNGNLLWQTNTTFQPSYTNTLVNGKPGLALTGGSRRWMQGATNLTASPARGVTVLYYGSAITGVTIQWFFDSRSGDRLTAFVNWPTSSTVTLWAGDAGGGANGASRSFINGAQLFTFEYLGSAGVAYTNNVSGSVVVTGTNSLTGFVLGSNQATTGSSVATLGEVAVIRRLLTPSERERLRIYFQRWN